MDFNPRLSRRMDYNNNRRKAHALPSGVLATSSFGSSTNSTSEIPQRSVGKGIGHFFGALEIDGFIDKDEFKKQIDDWIQVFRNTKPAPGTNGPLIPGDPEREAEAIRSKEGIPLLKPVVDDLLDISKKTGIPFAVNR